MFTPTRAMFIQVETFKRNVLQYGDSDVVIVVAANKADLPHHPTFSLAAVESACEELGVSLHLTSAVSGQGVDDLFVDVARKAVAKRRELMDRHNGEALGIGGGGGGAKKAVTLTAASGAPGGKKKSKPCC